MRDRNASNPSFKAKTSVRRRIIGAVLLFGIVLVSIPPASGYAVFTVLRREFAGKLQGRFEPVLFKTAFNVKDLRWELPGKVKVESGNVRVHYYPLSFLEGNGLRIRVTGERLPVEVLTAVLGQKFKKMTLERVTADIKLHGGELREIYQLEVVSPELNLKMGQS